VGFFIHKIMSSYYEKLRHPLWQKKRTQIMQRDNFTCVSCGNQEKTLNVHHKTYRKGADPWDYDDENFITYCEDCHGGVHEEKDFLMMHIDTHLKMRSLATIAYYCDVEHVRLAQVVCAISQMEKETPIISDDDWKISVERAEMMIKLCKKLITKSKQRIKNK